MTFLEFDPYSAGVTVTMLSVKNSKGSTKMSSMIFIFISCLKLFLSSVNPKLLTPKHENKKF